MTLDEALELLSDEERQNIFFDWTQIGGVDDYFDLSEKILQAQRAKTLKGIYEWGNEECEDFKHEHPELERWKKFECPQCMNELQTKVGL